MVSPHMSPGLPRRLLPFAVFITAFSAVMMILFLSMDMRATKHHQVFNFTQDLDFSSVDQNNPQLIAYIKAVHLQSPAISKTEYKNISSVQPSVSSLLVAQLLNNKKHGTFVETGAYGRGRSSDTEWLEASLGWHGLLIQADPWDFLALRRRRRKKAISVHACLSPTFYPKEVTFRQVPTDDISSGSLTLFTRVKCFPLLSLLLAANLTHLDYLSLDAEGAEMQVLKTLPLGQVVIQVISIQWKLKDEDILIAFMENHGYKLVQRLSPSHYLFKMDSMHHPSKNK